MADWLAGRLRTGAGSLVGELRDGDDRLAHQEGVEKILKRRARGVLGAKAGTDRTTERALKGDPDAVRVLWQRHRRWVAAILLAHKPREIDLEDLLQEVAMTLVARITTVRDPEAIKPWLRTVAINAARAAGRQATRRRPIVRTMEVDAPAAELDDPVERRERADRVLALIDQLPEQYKEPLVLRCVRQMGYREISAVLQLPETTIETRIARGRRMLRELIAHTDAGRPDAGRPSTGRPNAGQPDAGQVDDEGIQP